jgi:hypothetical protein
MPLTSPFGWIERFGALPCSREDTFLLQDSDFSPSFVSLLMGQIWSPNKFYSSFCRFNLLST